MKSDGDKLTRSSCWTS